MRRRVPILILALLLAFSAALVSLAFAPPASASHCWAQESYTGACCSCNNKEYKVRTCCSDGWCSSWSYRCDWGNCCNANPCCF